MVNFSQKQSFHKIMKEDAQHEASFQGKSELKKYCISIMVVVASLVPYVLGVFCCYLACILAEIWLIEKKFSYYLKRTSAKKSFTAEYWVTKLL